MNKTNFLKENHNSMKDINLNDNNSKQNENDGNNKPGFFTP